MTDADITHVLSWAPPVYAVDGGEGFWELWTIEAFTDPGEPFDFAALPPEASPADLASWITSVVGYPVSLEADQMEIRRRFGFRWISIPLFWVRRMPLMAPVIDEMTEIWASAEGGVPEFPNPLDQP